MKIEALDQSKLVVVVLGMHRSGTSAVARGIDALGISLGDRLEPPAAGINDKGYWEDIDIVSLNEEMLAALGLEWHSLESFSAGHIEFLWDKGFQSKAVHILRGKLAGREAFGFKDPRTAKLLPFWIRVFASMNLDARFVLTVRNPLSVASSLKKRDGFDSEKSFFLWAEHILTTLENTKGHQIVVVDYDRLLAAPETELLKIADRLNIPADVKAVKEYANSFIDTSLRHTTFSLSDVHIDHAAAELLKEMCNSIFGSQNVDLDPAKYGPEIAKWCDELKRVRPLMRLADRLAKEVVKNRTAAEAYDGELAEQRLNAEAQRGQIDSLEAAKHELGVQLERVLSEAALDREALSRQLNDAQIQGELLKTGKDEVSVQLERALSDAASERETLSQQLNDARVLNDV